MCVCVYIYIVCMKKVNEGGREMSWKKEKEEGKGRERGREEGRRRRRGREREEKEGNLGEELSVRESVEGPPSLGQVYSNLPPQRRPKEEAYPPRG